MFGIVLALLLASSSESSGSVRWVPTADAPAAVVQAYEAALARLKPDGEDAPPAVTEHNVAACAAEIGRLETLLPRLEKGVFNPRAELPWTDRNGRIYFRSRPAKDDAIAATKAALDAARQALIEQRVELAADKREIDPQAMQVATSPWPRLEDAADLVGFVGEIDLVATVAQRIDGKSLVIHLTYQQQVGGSAMFAMTKTATHVLLLDRVADADAVEVGSDLPLRGLYACCDEFAFLTTAGESDAIPRLVRLADSGWVTPAAEGD